MCTISSHEHLVASATGSLNIPLASLDMYIYMESCNLALLYF